MELRDKHLYLSDIIRNIEHIYDMNGDIEGTRIIYKRSIKKIQEIDLSRCYSK